jgi:NTP pyrophosphatase (non-canonical NTP hydrolase)
MISPGGSGSAGRYNKLRAAGALARRGSHPGPGGSQPTAIRLGVGDGIAELQETLRRTYYERDSGGARRHVPVAHREVGEVARALRGDGDLVHEFGDVLAWLGSLANLAGVDLEEAAARYANGCPKCGAIPCACAFSMTNRPPNEERLRLARREDLISRHAIHEAVVVLTRRHVLPGRRRRVWSATDGRW